MDWYETIDVAWYIDNTVVNISVFDALSIGSGLVAAVLLCMKREAINHYSLSYNLTSTIF